MHAQQVVPDVLLQNTVDMFELTESMQSDTADAAEGMEASEVSKDAIREAMEEQMAEQDQLQDSGSEQAEAEQSDLADDESDAIENEKQVDKEWLFRESIRIQSERQELDAMYEQFAREKEQFHEEMESVNYKITMDRKRLKQDEAFFQKKMEILKGGFAQLEADRSRLDRERKEWESRKVENKRKMDTSSAVRLFFVGVDNPLTLKKRFRDLIKIYHPDNLCGDTEVLRLINNEYEMLQDEFGWQRKA